MCIKIETVKRNRTMSAAVTLVLSVALLFGVRAEKLEDPDAHMSHFIADIWLEGADVVRLLWRDCSKKLVDVKDVIDHKEYFPKFVRCMKRKTLRALDRSLSTDIVPVAEGVNLVRFEMVDRTGNVMPDNYTSSWSEKELEEGEWRTLAMQRMAKVLRTHVIKFDFEEGKAPEKVEFRGRRRHQMMVMMMFGVVSIGMIMIPMGFQFLAVLGGKALLLAKMALILASIQGLKKVDNNDGFHDRGKIGTSPVNYGFYHSYPPYDQYEKRSGDNWPPPSLMAGTPPPLSRNSWNLDNGNIKTDRIHIAAANTDEATAKRDTKFDQSESKSRLYPVYLGPPPSPSFSVIDSPTPLIDLTTTPGEVQADYALELPYNGFRFQSPTPVVSS